MEENNEEHKVEEDKPEEVKPEEPKVNVQQTNQADTVNEEPKKRFSGFKINLSTIKTIYETQYKKLLFFPITLLLIAILIIGIQFAATGEFIEKDVSLKGGVTVTIPTTQPIDIIQLENTLSSIFLNNDVSTKSLSKFGKQVGVIVEVDFEKEQVNTLIDEIGNILNLKLTTQDYSIEIVGSSLGASFFKEIITAILIAFVLMAIVVFIYFRTLVPSAAVILAVFSDLIITLAIVNILGVKVSAAGIAAFLMIIGYSVDTNILLSTRVLKRKEGTETERFYGALKTGIMMSTTTLIAVSTALIFSQSEIIKQIMIILLIGLIVDLINTWIQNVSILRIYLERKARKGLQ